MKSLAPRVEAHVETPLKLNVQRSARTLSRSTQWALYAAGLLITDAAAIALAFRLAYIFRFELSLAFFKLEVVPSPVFYQSLIFLLVPLWLIVFGITGLYNRQNLLGGTEEYSMIFRANMTSFLVVIVAGFLEPALIIARGWLLVAWMFTFLFASVGRFTMRRIVYTLRKQGLYLTPAVIVGANDEGRSLADQLLRARRSGLRIVGFVDEKLPSGALVHRNLHVLGAVDDLDKIIAHHNVEELVLASSAISSREKMLDIFKRYGVSSNVNVRLSSGLYEIITTGLHVKEFAYVPLVGVNKVRLTGADVLFKLFLDYSLTIPGLIAISPLLLLLALAVKLDSPGSIIHRRRVMGVNGRQFDAFKFRTMYVNGDEILNSHPELKAELALNHKLRDDPRITRIGKFLRKYSLDELPQLFNVLMRDMSLVGPRMISPVEMEKYAKKGINLLTVKPGITGMWQVSGRSDVSYEERVRMDMYYVRNWTIWLDIQLLAQTIPAVLKGRGAY